MADTDARTSLISLLQGVEKFNTEVFPQNRELFAELADQQSPDTLFIACADSRVNPSMITQTRPGDLFVLRNIGNIVPAYGEMLGGVSSAIEYAVLALGVSHIIVCGHSDCGAMKALLDPDPTKLARMPTVASWLRNAEAARAVAGVLQATDAGPQSVRSLAEQNVLLQIAHLRTHPAVAAGLARNTLILQGWFYDIASGEVVVLDETTRTSIHVDEAIARLNKTGTETPAA
ncbi:Carbonate dehydratase [Gluconacetobacter diazotrophicus PA1 5]|uniref:Carbonic anhydrase n=2 Tax=Gluconacetobacter diazotrophicus TaxID=33996 RepID=A9HL77_GLUDA|nr:carbonic anhydrase [Gluconacetobacter diazotrophicus]ACI50204.1 Carbonate dehydratase [Gluconacetobacter diazotrophicus PA1 5]MBB2154876.1 carbonic anhydrase [Gluconacetobacter diazotrophicus]TWB08040.1 carbonic anhydrase [Gluconacetobacter diazotrophicus]CAP56131.1 Carbonic anhydrase 1 [Gluconacetobacter diazotrophicus PA1 5]